MAGKKVETFTILSAELTEFPRKEAAKPLFAKELKVSLGGALKAEIDSVARLGESEETLNGNRLSEKEAVG